jgi:DNA-binding LacI/PurR family transcriptional regulator
MEAKKSPKIRDVALRAGVSPATVSNVLAGRATVNPALAERVRAAVRELGYEVHRFASQLRSGKSHVVAVIVPSLENPFFTSLIASIERHARGQGYDIVVASANDDEAVERARLAALLSWRPLGVVIVPCTDAFGSRSVLAAAGVPHVVVDRVVEGLAGVDAVTVHNRAAAGLAAEHLVGLGHRDVLVVASTLGLGNIRERWAGVRGVFARAHRGEPAVLEVGLDFEEATRRLVAHLERRPCPTGIIALTNFVTLGAMAALAQLTLRVPEQVSLVGFDDYVWMRAATPPVTAVRQPIDDLGAVAVRLLGRRIRGDLVAPSRIRLACELVERGSTRRIGPARVRRQDLPQLKRAT